MTEKFDGEVKTEKEEKIYGGGGGGGGETVWR